MLFDWQLIQFNTIASFVSECLTTPHEQLKPKHSSATTKESTTKANSPTSQPSSLGNVALIAIFGGVFLFATFIIVFAMCMVYKTYVNFSVSVNKVSLKKEACTKSKIIISNDQELIQSDPTSCSQNQKGNN